MGESRAGKVSRVRETRLRIIEDDAPRPASITNDMIEAGALILSEYGGLGPYTAKHLAEDVYRVMTERAGLPKSKD
jgi:hypothetical protein